MMILNTYLHFVRKSVLTKSLTCNFTCTRHLSTIKWNGNEEFLKIHHNVKHAILNKKPVIALESTIITHGMPYPENYQTAVEVEEIVKQKSVVPATIAMIDGFIHVGLSKDDLRRLSTSLTPVKISRRGLLSSVAFKQTGGTTVSATMLIAHRCGIPIFVTGGIGGVHRGVGSTMDVSSDLTELGRTPVTVISAGIKSILDIPKTLEYLETSGVTVATFGESDSFPAFFTSKSGCRSQMNVRSASDAARMIRASERLNMDSGCLIAVPIPDKYAASGEKIENAIMTSMEEAKDASISGADVTPYILNRVNELTGGESLKANVALIKHNASVGAEIATKLAKSYSLSAVAAIKCRKNTRPVVIGATNIDVTVKCTSEVLFDGPSNLATISYTLGGVGRNISESLARYGDDPVFISLLGDDGHAAMAEAEMKKYIDLSFIGRITGCGSGLYNSIIDERGFLKVAAEAMAINDRMSADYIRKYEDTISRAPIVCVDANLPSETLHYVCDLCKSASVDLFFEPTGSLKAARAFTNKDSWKSIKYLSPNLQEFEVIISSITGKESKIDLNENGKFAEKTLRSIHESCRPLMEHVHCLIVTLAGKGVATFVQDDTASTGITATHFPLSTVPEFLFMSNPITSVSGSGDAFTAAFIHGLLEKKSVETCTKMGLVAAQYSLRSKHAVPPDFSTDLFQGLESVDMERQPMPLYLEAMA